MGIMDLFKRRLKTEPQQVTADSIVELDKRQHEVARRLHILEYETSAEVRAMKRRLEEERRHIVRRKDDQ